VKRVQTVTTAAALGLATVGLSFALVPGGQSTGTGAHAQATKAPAGETAKGKELFDTFACGTCHALQAAGASGQIGPSLDNPSLTPALIIDRITNGQGAMPGFGGQMSEQEIADVTAFIKSVAK